MRYFRRFNKYCCILFFILMACSHNTDIQPFISSDDNAVCSIPFITEKQRFIHVIEAELPNKANLSMIGITVISPETDSIQCVIMTIEGFVIFDAEYEHELKINRGVPPFDSRAFAQGMIDDIRLIFFKPNGVFSQSGNLKDGSHACRYTDKDNSVTDLITTPDNHLEIRKYDKNLELARSVKTSSDKEMIPERLELTAYGDNPYALKLKLIKYEKAE